MPSTTQQTRRGRGRPSALRSPFDARADGTVRTVGEAVIDGIRTGNYLETACAMVGIHVDTARGWLRVAAKARIGSCDEDAVDTGLTAHERACVDFSVAYARADADYEAATLLQLDEIARGGRRTASVRTKRRFSGPNDTKGFVVERIEETRTLPPDPQVLIWRLAHRFPRRYSPKLHVLDVDQAELTPDEQAKGLADALELFLASREEEPRDT